jgi:hypothetical protein
MAACPICTFADAHGWWGPSVKGGTHCRRCHRSWTSTGQAHCTVCHEHFTSDSAAERHWVKGRHTDPATIDGLYLGPDGAWSTSADRDPAAIRRAFVERVHPGRAA